MRPVDRMFRDDTSAHPDGVQRVIDRLGHGDDAIDLRELLSHLPEAPEHAVSRLKSRLELGRDRPRAVPWVAAGLAIAASVLLIWRATGTDGLTEAAGLPSTPQQEFSEASASDAPVDSAAPIAHVLDGGMDGSSLRPVMGLLLRYDGSGSLAGSTQAPEIRWDRGRIDLEVDPAAELSVSIETSEARVRVLGTVFAVERSPLGTNISVSRGRVQVDCQSGSSHTLVGGAMALCLPTTAAGMLGRSRSRVPSAGSCGDRSSLPLLQESFSVGDQPLSRHENGHFQAC